jgi:hypothetical protein
VSTVIAAKVADLPMLPRTTPSRSSFPAVRNAIRAIAAKVTAYRILDSDAGNSPVQSIGYVYYRPRRRMSATLLETFPDAFWEYLLR